MFISSAVAQEAVPPVSNPSPLTGILPIVVMVALFYFLLIRPQQKKISEHKKMTNGVRRGDKVILSGGIYGTVTRVDDENLSVEVAKGVELEVIRSSLSAVVTRSEPADSASAN